MIPKIIMYEIINKIKQNFHKEFISNIYKANDHEIEELLVESPEVINERIKAENRFIVTDTALKLMREIQQLCHV
jgi:tRNA1(Val) A37 N6-methylase TrmN6